jgi:hypothetical protein
VHATLSALAIAFTTYLAIGGLVWTVAPQMPLVLVCAVALYLATTWICVFWNSGALPRGAIPSPATWAQLGPARLGCGARARRRGAGAQRDVARRPPDARGADIGTWSLGASARC